MTTPETLLTLIIEETDGFDRENEPLTFGIPFPRGLVRTPSALHILSPRGQQLPCQTQALDYWPDQSIRWALFDVQVSLSASASEHYALCCDSASPPAETQGITLSEDDSGMLVNTGRAAFLMNSKEFKPFDAVRLAEADLLERCWMEVTGESGHHYRHKIATLFVETEGPLRTTIKVEGRLLADESNVLARFLARLHFYARHSFCKIDYTILNPNAAQHPGGLWDLGDPGSIYVQDLSCHLSMKSSETPVAEWTAHPQQPFKQHESGGVAIYQDSSGGENWQSTNHLNRFRQVKHSFRGYRVSADHQLLEEGNRASPIVAIRDQHHVITGAVKGFWENFPTALEADGQQLTVRLFPEQYQDVFELQGGEQKTHTFYLGFQACAHRADSGKPADLLWIQRPLIAHAEPEWYAQTKALSYITPYDADPHPEIFELIKTAIEGEESFVKRREIIDEYGWRNFGDMYADHESVYYKGEGIPVSHYNNQYDGIYGLLVQFVRSGDVRWFVLLNDLAHHVVDIDIYHTKQDRTNYNGGLFWHTDHYVDAGTSTHRGFSRMTMEQFGLSSYGGGLANEHNYTTGLMYHYVMTGEQASKEAALSLANWVIDMDDGSKTIFRYISSQPAGYASNTASHDYSYHGPGRGSGYSINALMDGYLLTRERTYLEKAEQLIQRCIHPKDDIAAWDLGNAELRWSYTVFLQVLGKYLDLKLELGEQEYLFCYARESLMHYAKWMYEHEVLYSTIYDQLEYPTETWPAQDLRKANVFSYAAKYSEDSWREQFRQKATFFLEKPLDDLFSFETRTLTRPLMLLMTNSAVPVYCELYPDETAPYVECRYDFGEPQHFKPQLYYAYKLRHFIYDVKHRIQGIKEKFF